MANEVVSWDFFIAHAGPDRGIAEALYELLAGSAKVFLDSCCLKPGDDWDRELARAQANSRVTLVLVSSRTGKSYYEREEIAAAVAMARQAENAHRLVPLYLPPLIPPEDLPYGLRIKHGITVGHNGDLKPAAQTLLELLRLPGTSTIGTTTHDATAPSAPPSPPDSATIRGWLTNGLSDEELTELCTDHFPSVFQQLSAGMSKNQKIQRLLEYCSRRRELPKLMTLLEKRNPSAFTNEGHS